MSWFPALDLAAQYWQGKRTLPKDYDVLARLRKAISDLPPDDSDVPVNSPDPLSQLASEASTEKHTWNVDEDRRLKKLAKTYDYDWEEVAAHMPQHSPIACQKRWEKKQRRKAAGQRKEEGLLREISSKPASQSTAEQVIAKEQQIEFLRQNALRLEEKIRMYKDELGRLEVDLDASQL